MEKTSRFKMKKARNEQKLNVLKCPAKNIEARRKWLAKNVLKESFRKIK